MSASVWAEQLMGLVCRAVLLNRDNFLLVSQIYAGDFVSYSYEVTWE